MQVLRRALGVLGFKPSEEPETITDYHEMMRDALQRIRMAELQIQEATSLEELDLGRAGIMSGWAEVQQLVRTAKRDRGIALRPIAETEELHRNMRDFLNHRVESTGAAPRRKTGTGR